MIDLKDVLLMPVAAGLSSQPIRRDCAVVAVAVSFRSAPMPGAAQVAVERSSADKRLQAHAAAVNAVDAKSIDDEMAHLRVDASLGFSVNTSHSIETDSQQQTCAPECDPQQHIYCS